MLRTPTSIRRRMLLYLLDPWEGRWPPRLIEALLERHQRRAITDNDRRLSRLLGVTFFVNCWHMNVGESAALWDQYGNAASVAIRSTIGRIKASIRDSKTVFIGTVEYADYASHFPLDEVWHPLRPALLKRKSFQHEHEGAHSVARLAGSHLCGRRQACVCPNRHRAWCRGEVPHRLHLSVPGFAGLAEGNARKHRSSAYGRRHSSPPIEPLRRGGRLATSFSSFLRVWAVGDDRFRFCRQIWCVRRAAVGHRPSRRNHSLSERGKA